MPKFNDSGKAYHVKKAQKRKKKRDKALNKMLTHYLTPSFVMRLPKHPRQKGMNDVGSEE